MKAWVFAILFVGMNLFGAVGEPKANVAYTAHIGGALFALAYYKAGCGSAAGCRAD